MPAAEVRYDATDGMVFDALHEHFGAVGVYDLHDPEAPPWHKHKGVEMRKIAALRKKYRTEPWELLVAIDYCLDRGIYPRSSFGLYEHLRAALEWHKTRHTKTDEQLSLLISEALETETDDAWIDRLLRVPLAQRAEVYEEWLLQRSGR